MPSKCGFFVKHHALRIVTLLWFINQMLSLNDYQKISDNKIYYKILLMHHSNCLPFPIKQQFIK